MRPRRFQAPLILCAPETHPGLLRTIVAHTCPSASEIWLDPDCPLLEVALNAAARRGVRPRAYTLDALHRIDLVLALRPEGSLWCPSIAVIRGASLCGVPVRVERVPAPLKHWGVR